VALLAVVAVILHDYSNDTALKALDAAVQAAGVSWHLKLQHTFFTLRMSLTALVLAACGPPLAIVAEISSLYILQVLRCVSVR
jgi:hypothetical protein